MATTAASKSRKNLWPLETARLVLRRLEPEDAPAIARLVGEWEVVRNLSDAPYPYPPAMAERWIASTWKPFELRVDFAYAVVRRGERDPIGAVLLRQSQREPALVDGRRPSDKQGAEIGYWLGKPYWAQGYATEAVTRLVAFGFEALGLARLWAVTLTDNAPSARVLEKAGFVREGEAEYDFPARGGLKRVYLYARERPAPGAELPPAPKAAEPATVLVSAVALVDGDGRVLLAQRPAGKAMAGLWEFPGGKVMPGETPERALIRELKEELSIDVAESCLAPFTFASHTYADFHLLMPLYVCRVWKGQVAPREGQNTAWVAPREMAGYDMPPADKPLVAMLRDFL